MERQILLKHRRWKGTLKLGFEARTSGTGVVKSKGEGVRGNPQGLGGSCLKQMLAFQVCFYVSPECGLWVSQESGVHWMTI